MSSGSLKERIAALSPEKRALLERRLQVREAPVRTASIERREGARHPPLSFAQQRLWFLDQLDPGQASYHLAHSMSLSSRLPVAVVEKALDEVVRRHETLRTTFVVQDPEPVQLVAPELHVPVEVIDLRGVANAAQRFEKRAVEEASQRFSLERGPLLRAVLFQLDGADNILLLAMHHIVSDAWSMGVLQHELQVLCSAYAGGGESPLPDLPFQYGDFATWQRDHLTGQRLESLVDYWQRQLDGMPGLLELPTDRPRPRVQSFEGGTYRVPYPLEPLNALKALARNHDATLFMTLLAVFKVLLHRFSGIADMVVGAPIANRNRVELESLIGFFVNTLVLRTDLSGGPTFRTVLERVREVSLAAFAHQDLPFEKLVEELSPERNLSHNPLFQVMFGLENVASQMASHNAVAGLSFGTSKFDLTLDAVETAEGLTCAFEFNTQLFAPATIRSLAAAFGVLLQAVGQDPDRPIAELPLLDPAERQRLLAASATDGDAPPALLVHEIFEQQVAQIPDRPAARFGDEVLSYAELDERANRLARALRAEGAGPDCRVGLCMGRSLDLVVAMLGILKAGAAFVPLDPTHPRDRLDFMLRDTGAGILLAGTGVLDALPSFDGTLWCLDRDRERIDGMPSTPLPPAATPDHLAYVIYTSGSTGRPKGVMVPHRCACNSAQAQIEALELAVGTRVLQFGSLSFDISIFDLLMAFGCGGTLCLAPQEDLLPGPPLVETLRRERINVMTIPPSALAVAPAAELPDLHSLVSGGEALGRDLLARWLDGRRVLNAYGPTETAIWATFHPCTDAESAPPIGRAIANTQAYVLTADGQPAPVGFPGEVCLGGAGVARGYLARPGLTAAAYVPDPFSDQPGARMYRTGDRARSREDGAIQFLGRFDHQLKLRGYRIELAEIEAVLLAHPDVHEAAVVSHRLPSGDKRLAAFCVPAQGEAVEEEQLFAHLRRSLPEFMVPSVLRLVPTLPLSPSGKLDRHQLATWATEEEATGAAQQAPPRTELEQAMAAIFRDVLERRSEVGASDNFFDLGGHSLLATRVITRVNDSFGVALTLRQIFEAPTVSQLAAVVERAMEGGESAGPSPIGRRQREPVAMPLEDSGD